MFFSLWNKNKVVLSDEHVLKLFEKHFSGKKAMGLFLFLQHHDILFWITESN